MESTLYASLTIRSYKTRARSLIVNYIAILTWVYCLNSLYVIRRQLDIRVISFVPRVHDGFPHAGMF